MHAAIPALPVGCGYTPPVKFVREPCLLCCSRVESCEKTSLHYVAADELGSRPMSLMCVLCAVCRGHYYAYCKASGFPRVRSCNDIYGTIKGPRPARLYRCNPILSRDAIGRCEHGHCKSLMEGNAYGYIAAIPRDIRGMILQYIADSVSDHDYPDDGPALCDFCRGAYILMY